MNEHPETAALKHGGEAAIKRLADGQPFTAMALERQGQVEVELADSGVDAIIERNAVRLQTAADLYFDALLKAAQDGNEKLFDGYVGRFGWLTGKTLLAWAQVRESRKSGKPKLHSVLDAYDKEKADEPSK